MINDKKVVLFNINKLFDSGVEVDYETRLENLFTSAKIKCTDGSVTVLEDMHRYMETGRFEEWVKYLYKKYNNTEPSSELVGIFTDLYNNIVLDNLTNQVAIDYIKQLSELCRVGIVGNAFDIDIKKIMSNFDDKVINYTSSTLHNNESRFSIVESSNGGTEPYNILLIAHTVQLNGAKRRGWKVRKFDKNIMSSNIDELRQDVNEFINSNSTNASFTETEFKGCMKEALKGLSLTEKIDALTNIQYKWSKDLIASLTKNTRFCNSCGSYSLNSKWKLETKSEVHKGILSYTDSGYGDNDEYSDIEYMITYKKCPVCGALKEIRQDVLKNIRTYNRYGEVRKY